MHLGHWLILRNSYPKHLAEVRVSEAERDVGDVQALRLGLTWPLLITSTSRSAPRWHRHAQRLGVRGQRGQNVLLTGWEGENRRRAKEHRGKMTNWWEGRGSERTNTNRKTQMSMNEMRIGEKKKRREGISRKTKKERERNENNIKSIQGTNRSTFDNDVLFGKQFSRVSITWH